MADTSGHPRDRPERLDRVLVLDSELDSSAAALHVDESVFSTRDQGADGPGGAGRAGGGGRAQGQEPSDGREPNRADEPGGVRPVTFLGAEQGNAATEILDPFVRAIEVLLQGLAGSLGERGSPATIRFGSMVIEYSGLGVGDDVVRVHRMDPHEPAKGPEPAADVKEHPALRSTADRWELGSSAAREGNHAAALELFEAEAREAEAENVHQRAAIAYRSASREAGWIGRRDYANKLLRLAGKHYLFVAEDVHITARGKVQAFVTAAKCFLQAGNLSLAESCIARARSGAQALSDTE